jgi:hypothetical protein
VWRWSAALAAGLILGVIVDRTLARPSSSRVPETNVANRDSVSHPVEVANAGAGAAIESVRVPSTIQVNAPPATSASPHDRRTRDLANVSPTSDVRSPATNDSAVATAPNPRDLYHAAAMQTLVQAEALLTAYRANGDAARDPQALQQAARWARDVLSSTRLLMDSPAARDPQMRALFTDLELVLAQIVQLSGAPLQGAERELIERAMRDRDLLPRLRTAVPAGATS